MFPSIELEVISFTLGFLISEFLGKKLYPCYLLIKRKKIRLHHAYIGAFIAIISSLMGQMTIASAALGSFINDVYSHLKKKFKK